MDAQTSRPAAPVVPLRGPAVLRTVAILEATKGLLVLLAGSGLLLLVHRDVQWLAERIVLHTHLNPASHYPRIFLEWADAATPERFRLLALGAACYAVARFVEAGGLWRDRRWAEWFGVATGLVYVPFEARVFARHPGVESLVALLVNLAVVIYLAWRLRGHASASSGST